MEAVPGQKSGENHFPTNLIDSEKLKDKIIRTESPEELNQRYKGKIEIPDLLKIAEHLFEEIEEKYGILVPASFFVGRDNSANSIVDKIEGKNLAQANVSNEIVPQVQKLYASVAKYFLDKLMYGGFYLTDINNPNQYVYGRKRGESEDKIYLIDTDLSFITAELGFIWLWSGSQDTWRERRANSAG